MKTIIVVTAAVCAISYLGWLVSILAFDDDDPDMDYMDNYAVSTCPHPEKHRTDVVVQSHVTCEVIHTICDDCSAVLNIRTDC